MSITVKMEGLDKLTSQIQALAQSLEPEKVEPLFLDGAQVIANDAQGRASQGPTGNLKRSIHAKQLKRQGNEPAPAIAAVDRIIAPHGHLVEFGTSKAVAKPYFRPAVDANIDKVYSQIINELKKKVEGAVK